MVVTSKENLLATLVMVSEQLLRGNKMTENGGLPKCDKEVYNSGITVLISHSVPPKATERFVKLVAKASEQKVDWFFVGGRIVVKAVGDIDKVNEALDFLKPTWERLYHDNNPDYTKYTNQEVPYYMPRMNEND